MTCKNPECGKHIEKRKSAKRCYCNDRCKNRAAYIRRKENWHEVDAHNKVLKTLQDITKTKEFKPWSNFYANLTKSWFCIYCDS